MGLFNRNKAAARENVNPQASRSAAWDGLRGVPMANGEQNVNTITPEESHRRKIINYLQKG